MTTLDQILIELRAAESAALVLLAALAREPDVESVLRLHVCDALTAQIARLERLARRRG